MAASAARATLLRGVGAATTAAAAAAATVTNGGGKLLSRSAPPRSIHGGSAAIGVVGASDHDRAAVPPLDPAARASTPSRSAARPTQQRRERPPPPMTTTTTTKNAPQRGVGVVVGGCGSAALGLGGGVSHTRVGGGGGGGSGSANAARRGAAFSFAARGLSTGGDKGSTDDASGGEGGGEGDGDASDGDDEGFDDAEFEDDKDEEAARAMVGKDEFGGLDPDDLPPDELLPEHLRVPSWLRKRPTRAEKGNYEGFAKEIDTYEEFEPENGGNLYNLREFSMIGDDATSEDIKAWCDNYWEHQRQLYIARGGGDPNVTMDEFKVIFDQDFEVTPEERKRHILFWQTTQVLENGAQNDHPLNRKVVLTVRLMPLQRETGLSNEALEYIKEICGKRFNDKKNEIKIICTRSRNREHNRQWCLKVLYDLIAEGNAEYPSDTYCFTPEGPREPGTF